MKYILLIVSIVFCNVNSQAQVYTANVPTSTLGDSTYVVTLPLDSMNISQHPAYTVGQFVVCANNTFIFKGNQSSSAPTFYLEPGAKLYLKDTYFYPSIIMSSFSELHAENGSQNIQIHRMTNCSLFDTSNANILNDSNFTSVNITYNGWPSNLSPCVSPSAIKNNSITTSNINMYYNSFSKLLSISTSSIINGYRILDITGKLISTNKLTSNNTIDCSSLHAGLYIIQLHTNKGSIVHKQIID